MIGLRELSLVLCHLCDLIEFEKSVFEQRSRSRLLFGFDRTSACKLLEITSVSAVQRLVRTLKRAGF